MNPVKSLEGAVRGAPVSESRGFGLRQAWLHELERAQAELLGKATAPGLPQPAPADEAPKPMNEPAIAARLSSAEPVALRAASHAEVSRRKAGASIRPGRWSARLEPTGTVKRTRASQSARHERLFNDRR